MIPKIYMKRLSGLDVIIPFFTEQSPYIYDEPRGIYIKFKKKLRCGVNYYVEITKE